jgi:putative endonuclease
LIRNAVLVHHLTVDTSTINSREAGIKGEAAVREHVQRLGWHVVDHNVRWREGELDLISVDGHDLVFAEVKTLIARGGARRTAFSPFESIDRRKQLQIRTLARRWLVDELRRMDDRSGRSFAGLRFDAFGVTLDEHGQVLEIEHLEDAF